MLTTIHGFSEPDILRVYRNYKDTYYVSISDSDRDPELPYVATVYNGIDLSNLTFRERPRRQAPLPRPDSPGQRNPPGHRGRQTVPAGT